MLKQKYWQKILTRWLVKIFWDTWCSRSIISFFY